MVTSTHLRALVAQLLLKRSEHEDFCAGLNDVRQSLAHDRDYVDPTFLAELIQMEKDVVAGIARVEKEIRQLEEALHLTPGAPLPPLT